MAASAGHGSLFAIELDPSGAQGTFTTVTLVQDLDWPEVAVPLIDASGQESPGSKFAVANFVMLSSVDVSVWYDPADQTHNIGTGLYNQLATFEKRGAKWTGPGGGTDVFIGSGYVQNISRAAPKTDGGMYQLDFTFQIEAPILIDATSVAA